MALISLLIHFINSNSKMDDSHGKLPVTILFFIRTWPNKNIKALKLEKIRT